MRRIGCAQTLLASHGVALLEIWADKRMRVASAVAEIPKREGLEASIPSRGSSKQSAMLSGWISTASDWSCNGGGHSA